MLIRLGAAATVLAVIFDYYKRKQIARFVEEYVYHLGDSAETGARCIIDHVFRQIRARYTDQEGDEER